MKVIKFKTPLSGPRGGYKIDDVASFEDEIADKIVTQGYGDEVTLESTKITEEIKNK